MKQNKHFIYSEVNYRASTKNAFLHNYENDYHLLIVDQAEYEHSDKIESIVSAKFTIVNKIEIFWSEERFLQNSFRLFGKDLVTKRFMLYVLLDKNPSYNFNVLEKIYVNVNSRDTSISLNNYSYTILTRNIYDFYRLSVLILGTKGLMTLLNHEKTHDVRNDPIGTKGWASFAEFIAVANICCDWLVLRNQEYLPAYFFENDKDVDLLCSNLDLFVSVMNLKKRSWGLAAYQVNVADIAVPFDVRFLGDGYYDKLWQYDMLQNKFFTEEFVPSMNKINYFFSLIYHTKIQKHEIKDVYIERVSELANLLMIDGYTADKIYDDKYVSALLSKFMVSHNYQYFSPIDINVIKNNVFVQYLHPYVLHGPVVSVPFKRRFLNLLPNKIITLVPDGIKKIVKKVLSV